MNDTSPLYLDHAAATPLDERVFAAMKPYLADQFYNPSAQYDAARQVKQAITEARKQIAYWLGCRPGELIFTAGGTEANNLVIRGIMEQFPDAHIVSSAVEHDSVLIPVQKYAHTLVPVQGDGQVSVGDIEKAMSNETVLVTIQYANNEVGTIQSIKRIAAMVAKVRKTRQAKGINIPLYFHTDACQAPAYLDIHVNRLGIDFMTINASKIYGPKQTGLLYVRTGAQLAPQVLGGGQERGMRSGTENVANIIGFAAALDLVQSRRHHEVERLSHLQELWLNLLEVSASDIFVNGSLRNRLPNNIHVTMPGHDNERLMMELDNRGIMCALGSACSASNEEPSHVLRAMGLSASDAQASLRFTMGRTTTEADVRRVVSELLSLTS